MKLFDLRGIIYSAIAPAWDVSRDGKRFIAIKNVAARPADQPPGADRLAFVFIVNWVEELRARLGVR